MFFDSEFVSRVEEKPIEGLVEACDLALAKLEETAGGFEWTEAEHDFLWEVSSFVQVVMEAESIDVGAVLPDAQPDVALNCKALVDFLGDVRSTLKGMATKLKVEFYKSKYSSALKSSFAYEFSGGDLERVQFLINEVRAHITECFDLEDDHRRRLLRRLERLQTELHKRVSDLDRFWGLVGDAGVVLGKLGTDGKPIVDRIREIAEIVWKTQARTEELPSDSQNPMIEHEDVV